MKSTNRKRFWRGEAAMIGAAALACLLLLALAYRLVWPLSINIGVQDRRFAVNFNAPETVDGKDIRWTNGASVVRVPRPPARAREILTLRAVNARPDGQPIPRVSLKADGQPFASFDVTRAATGMRTYRMLVASGDSLTWYMPVELSSDTILLPQDPRPLGFMLDHVTLELAKNTRPLAPGWLLLWGALLGAAGYGFPRSFRVRRGRALLVAVLVGALVAAGIALRPLDVLPFVHRIAALLALGTVAALLAQFFAPAVAEPGKPLLVQGSALPIYMAVASWMGPLFQILMSTDDATNVTPAPQTVWIGVALLMPLLALIGLALFRRSQITLTRGALALLMAAALANGIYLIWYGFQRQAPDFWILFKGAREWARGNGLYDLVAINADHFGHVFKVPPFYGMLFLPFVFQDGERILLFHRIINTVLIGVAFVIWYRMWRIKPLSALGIGTLVLLDFRPLSSTLALGQIDLVLLVILLAALWALRNGRDGAAGALVALGTLFKLYPILLLGFFVAKWRWRGVAGFAIGMLLFNAVSIAAMGWDTHRTYLFDVLPRISGTTAWVENQTIAGFLTRLVDTPQVADIFTNRPVALLANGISALVILAGCALALRPAERTSTTFALQFSVFPLIMVLAVPAAWMHYETLLFMPFGALLIHWHNRAVPLHRAVALAVSFGLVAYGNQWSFYDGSVMGVLTIIGISSKCYGMLLLGGIIVAAIREAPAYAAEHTAATWLARNLKTLARPAQATSESS